MKKSWLVTTIGFLIHLCLGTVYAWSYFQNPIVESTGWSNTKVAFAFSLAILFLGITAAVSGSKIDQYKPNRMAFLGGILYGLGYIISSFALDLGSIFLFYLGFGVLSGIGLGLAYVTPVATVSRWFTKNQGLVTGIVVMGFGLGAFLMSKILGPIFFEMTGKNMSKTFLYIGLIFIVLIPILSLNLRFPESDSANISNQKNYSFKEIINNKTIIIWLFFTLNIIAGMIFISFQSPLIQELLKSNPKYDSVEKLAKAGATLVAVSALFNGVGRFGWASLSDKIGRINAFRTLIFIEILCFALLIFVKNPIVFSVLVCVILFCYGGGFGILPSLVKDEFGSEKMATVYGIILTGWGIGGLIGPQLIAYLKDNLASEAGFYAYIIGLVLLGIGFVLTLFYSKIKVDSEISLK